MKLLVIRTRLANGATMCTIPLSLVIPPSIENEAGGNRETDLDEVLQIHSVFTNVSKGQVAKLADWTAAFKTTDLDQVIRDILKNGQVQVNEKEREVQLDSLHRDIITIIAEKCVNPNTKRPYTVSMIEKAVQELPHSWTLTKSAKQQVGSVGASIGGRC